jgi:signal transduction histidine kinase/Flp pilus assembly protein TadD
MAMNDRIRQLEAKLASSSDPRERIDVLNALAWELRHTDLQRAISLNDQAYDLATQSEFESQPYVEGLAQSLRFRGVYHARLGNYDLALSMSFEAMALFRDAGKLRDRAHVLNDLGNAYLCLGFYPEALKYYLGALEAFEIIDDREWKAGLLNNVGLLYLERDDPAKALTYLEKSLQISRRHGYQRAQADALDNSCNAYCSLGEYEKALDRGLESVGLYRAIGMRPGEAEVLNSVGEVYQCRGDYPQALEYHRQALRIAQEVDLKFEVIEALLSLGGVHRRLGQVDPALSHLHRALSIAEEIGAKRKLYQCHQALTQVYKQAGDFERALAHHEQFHAIERSVFSEQADWRLKTLEVEHQVEKVRREAEIRQLRNVQLEREISERKRAEEALCHHAAELEVRNEELDAFAHTVAHDLKDPLSLILGIAEKLAEDYAATPEQEAREFLKHIAETSFRMANIVDELLLLARVRRKDVQIEALDMAGIIAEVRMRLGWMIEESGAEIIRPEDWPVALGYGPWIEEVWVNYVSNAIRYGGQPPRVELGADMLPTGMIRFWVRDNGPGIGPEERDELFAPFTHLDQIRAQGYGLGLSIVRRIVEKLGGRAQVQSEVGRGSVFFFELPGVEGVKEGNSMETSL